jgi:tRNA 5-methylaminomethyl-2-thiouridine biosynthesis bifunctional protein
LSGAAGLPTLQQPWADTGYALRLADGRVLFGATSQLDDDEPGLRDADHLANLATLRRLTGWQGKVDPEQLDGRVGWRLQSDDRLPLLGPVPDSQAIMGASPTRHHDQPRHVPRHPGVHVFTALGSRGISHAALGAEVLASWLLGNPVPAPASLMDALDPARFIARAVRRAG